MMMTTFYYYHYHRYYYYIILSFSVVWILINSDTTSTTSTTVTNAFQFQVTSIIRLHHSSRRHHDGGHGQYINNNNKILVASSSSVIFSSRRQRLQKMIQHSSSSTKLYSSTSPQQQSLVGDNINIDESTPRDLGSFDEWCTSYGGVQRSDGFQLTQLSSQSEVDYDVNIGVMTTTEVQAGQPVLFVPSGMVLTGTKVRQELGVVAEIENEQVVGPLGDSVGQFYLFIKILREYELGQQTPYYPWLNSLPRYFSNGSSMTKLCSGLLPPLVGQLTCKEQTRFRQFFHGLNYCSHVLSQSTINNKQLAKWAFAIVCTRSFPIPSSPHDGSGSGIIDYHITPMADMFNHGAEPEIDIQFDEEGNCYALATKDIPAGSHLRISYGDPTNPSFLFARYGFVDESTQATFCKLIIQDPVKQLVDMGYDHSRMLFYSLTGDVSQEVYDVILYRLLGQNNGLKDVQNQFYQAHMNNDIPTKSTIHQQYWSDTLKALLKHIDDVLEELDELQNLADIHVHSTDIIHPRLPLITRHNQFVKTTFETVKNRLLLL